MSAPAVLLADEARAALRRGFDQLAELLGLTLGPLQGQVLTARETGRPVEPLSDAATIARRFLALPDRAESAGAMLLRNMVWRVHQTAGDGCATAAVLASAMVAEAERYRAAGVHPLALRQGLEAGAAAAIAALQAQARPLAGEEELLAVAQAIVGPGRLAELIAELFDLLGAEASVELDEYTGPYLEREYQSGGRWVARLASPYLIGDQARQRAVLHDCPVALFSGELTTLAEVRPLLELIAGTGEQRLALVAHKVAGEALAALVLNHQQGRLAIGVAELGGAGEGREAACDDLAALCGARVYRALTDRLSSVEAGGLGRARRVEIGPGELVLAGGPGGEGLRGQIAGLRGRLVALASTEGDTRRELSARLARLTGATARLKIGAVHKVERELLRRQAERGISAVRQALEGGVLVGGGVAYLSCAEAALAAPATGDAVYGLKAVATTLAAPHARLIANSGRDDATALIAEGRRLGPSWGYDPLRGELADLWAGGVMDAASVAITALRAASSAAVMLLTTDAVVLKRNPQTSFEP